jgi:hypothetical protein
MTAHGFMELVGLVCIFMVLGTGYIPFGFAALFFMLAATSYRIEAVLEKRG